MPDRRTVDPLPRVPGNRHRPAQARGDPFEHRDVLGLIPQAACGEHKAALSCGAEQIRAAAVRNYARVVEREAIILREPSQHRARRRNDKVRGGEPAPYFFAVAVPLGRRGFALHGAPPGKHAGMRDYDDGRAPWERRVGVAVQVHHVRMQPAF
jgi:hypothetical protein